jgi:hypothetical protein
MSQSSSLVLKTACAAWWEVGEAMMDVARLAEAWGWSEGVSLVGAILRLSVAVTVRRKTYDNVIQVSWNGIQLWRMLRVM